MKCYLWLISLFFVSGVDSGAIDAFMWEVFTTKPWFDRKELQYLGEVPTPWPAFVFVTQTSVDAPISVGKSTRSAQDSTATEVVSALKQEKAQLIRDRLFAALHKGVTIFRQEAREVSGGDGKSKSVAVLTLTPHTLSMCLTMF